MEYRRRFSVAPNRRAVARRSVAALVRDRAPGVLPAFYGAALRSLERGCVARWRISPRGARSGRCWRWQRTAEVPEMQPAERIIDSRKRDDVVLKLHIIC